MFDFFIKGLLIGVLVSAPMGPIGMLCVQRTLNRGRWHGFVTGVGAMFSDLIYALIMLAGVSYAEDFFSKNELALQYIGSIVLIGFGYFVFRSNPLKNWDPNLNDGHTYYKRDFITSFLITLSNVAILLVFITLFARFQFNPIDNGIKYLGVSLLAIGIGALSWWFLLSTIVSRLRKHFNRRGLVILNRVIGSFLILVGLIGIFIPA